MVRHLLQRRLAVRALVQNPHSARAKALADQGIEIAQGDMDDLASLKKAMAGVHGAYSVQDYFTVGAAREVQEGKNMAGAALDAGVEHFVFSSVGGAERNSGIHHFETKWEIENHIRKLGLPATMIRPAGFMENYYIPQLEKAAPEGAATRPDPCREAAPDDRLGRHRQVHQPGVRPAGPLHRAGTGDRRQRTDQPGHGRSVLPGPRTASKGLSPAPALGQAEHGQRVVPDVRLA